MARDKSSKPNWTQIRSDALTLPEPPGGPVPDLREFRPKPTERQLSVEKIRAIAAQTKCHELSEAEIETLDILLNDALLYFTRSRVVETSSRTPKQLTKAYDEFHDVVKALVKSLPGSRDSLFWAISDKGDDFARNAGPHPGLNPYRAGISSPDEEGRVADQWLIFRSEERLDEFCSLVRQVSSWLTVSFTPPKRAAELSPSVWLIGEELPKIFERGFGRKYGKGESGSGFRFVKAVLKAANIRTGAGKSYKAGTIKAYRSRATRFSAG
jgi:hypothetical protein